MLKLSLLLLELSLFLLKLSLFLLMSLFELLYLCFLFVKGFEELLNFMLMFLLNFALSSFQLFLIDHFVSLSDVGLQLSDFEVHFVD